MLFSFIGKSSQQANYKIVEETLSEIEVEAASFQEHEDNHYTSDKQVFFKRIRYWDAFIASSNIGQIEDILSRN